MSSKIEGNCKLCGANFVGRKDKVFCTRDCKGKYFRLHNKEYISAKNKKWALENRAKKKAYMEEYRAGEEYRLMKQRHDKKYNQTHSIKKTRNAEQVFKSACRAYAARRIKKEKCFLCSSKSKLELHHDQGYNHKCVKGVKVVCQACHHQVIHGRGSRIDGTKI